MANQRPQDANNPASNQGNPKTNAPRTDGGKTQGDSGTKPAGENRPQGRDGVDAPRTEQNRPAGKPAPQYDDRPAQQRGGSGDSKNPAAPLPNNPKTPNYGDQEDNDPRRLDVDASNQAQAGDKKRSGTTPAKEANDAGGRSGTKPAGDQSGKRG